MYQNNNKTIYKNNSKEKNTAHLTHFSWWVYNLQLSYRSSQEVLEVLGSLLSPHSMLNWTQTYTQPYSVFLGLECWCCCCCYWGKTCVEPNSKADIPIKQKGKERNRKKMLKLTESHWTVCVFFHVSWDVDVFSLSHNVWTTLLNTSLLFFMCWKWVSACLCGPSYFDYTIIPTTTTTYKQRSLSGAAPL